MDYTVLDKLPGALIPWYRNHQRDLPWRKDRQPYHVWVSEIMLQQTRVEAVKEYYTRFLEALPDIAALASCDDGKLHKLWEGLGYYNRVRNMKKAAAVIMQQHGGSFPSDYMQILTLPGIGEYTAGAISSICFDLPVAAVDGNVLRVITRLTEDPTPIDDTRFKRKVKAELERVYPAEAGAFTQAIMELGATVCGPNKAPSCESCPCGGFCVAAFNNTVLSLPVRIPRKEKKLEEKTVFVLSCDGHYAVCKRPGDGLLADLWQLPDANGIMEVTEAISYLEQMGVNPTEIYKSVEKDHVFTHVKWKMRGYYIEVSRQTELFSWFTAEQIRQDIALPTAYRQFWQARGK